MIHIYWWISQTCFSSHKSRDTQVFPSKVRKQSCTEFTFSYRSLGVIQLWEDTRIRLFCYLTTGLAVRAVMCLVSSPVQNGGRSNLFPKAIPTLFRVLSWLGWKATRYEVKCNSSILWLYSDVSNQNLCRVEVTLYHDKFFFDSFDSFFSCLALCFGQDF